MMSSVSWKKSKPLKGLDPNTVSPDGGEEPQSIQVLTKWLQRLRINQTEDNSIPMSEPDGMPVVEEDGRLKPRCPGGFRPIPCSDFIDWIPTVGLEDLVIKKIVLWRSRDPPWHHEFVVVTFEPDDKYTGPIDIFLPNLSEKVPIQKLVATGLTLRIDRGRRSPVPFGSRQIAVDVVEIMNPDANLGNCAEFWSACADRSRDVEFFPTMRDLAYFLKNTMAKFGEDYHLRRNCWNFAARLISLMTFYFICYWGLVEVRPPEVIWARQKFGGFDGFGSIFRHLDSLGVEYMPRHQTPFRGLIDVLRGFRKISSSNSVALFPFVLIASLSPSLVGDLVNLDFSLSALAYGLYYKDVPSELFMALYTLTRLAKGGDSKAKAILIVPYIFECSAKYMQCEWSVESDRVLIHMVVDAFYSLFSEGDNEEIGNAFVKSGWILALPRVFIFYPNHLFTIGLYFALQSIEAARSHLITTSVLHSIFNFIQNFKSDDNDLMSVIIMICNIAEWSPSSRQALLDAGLGTTITKILRGNALNDVTLNYLVKLLESLILVVPRHFHSLINKDALDSLKDAEVFQALQENYPSVLLFRHFTGTQPPLDIIEEIASNPHRVIAHFLETHPEHVTNVMSYLVKEGISGEGDLWKMSSSNPEELFPFVFIASLSSDFVRDLVDLNVSLIAIAYCDAHKDDPVRLFNALYTLTRLAKGGDSKAKAMLVTSDIFERSAKYMQTWSRESDREQIHLVINAFYSLFSEEDNEEIGNAFVKSGWILALPRVFIFYPDHLPTIGLYFALQSIEAARSHLITTGVLHSIFNCIQLDESYKNGGLMAVIAMICIFAERSPIYRQALLDAGLGTTITKILQSRNALNDVTLNYLVKLLKILILVNSSQDWPSYSLIKETAVDSLKDAGVFQALQENYPSVLLFRSFTETQPPLDIVDELASNSDHVIVRLLVKTQPEEVSKALSHLVKKGVIGEEDASTFQSMFPDLLHDSEHSLLTVVVTPLHIGPCEQCVDPNINAVLPMTPPLTPNEVHTAIPHPHAFSCQSHNDVNMLTPERACAVLEIQENADESMLCAAFILRVQEFPAQAEKWREALSIIAKVRESERLCQFLEMATNPSDLVVPTPQDLPRGLNQLGNTCYLNSLLQYFYIIRDLRDAIGHSDVKDTEGDKLTDDNLVRHRVGGRNVIRREIARAKKFVGHLADLFWQMEHYQTASITPARELANLALLTSKDEEDEESDKGGMDLSNNALLAEDRLSRFPNFESSNSTKPLSVLGKCPNDDFEVIVDSPEKDSSKTSPQPISPNRSETSPPSERARPSSRSRMTTLVPLDGDDAMSDSDSRVGEGPSQRVTSLPVKNAKTLEPVRKFGQQHDVFECMDNCMFQIETALLKFDENRDDKLNVVKRLFYGKMRQCILPRTVDEPSIDHAKEDLFSHLPVSVSDDGTDLYDGLSRYMDNAVEYQGRKARMKVSVVELPSILQVQLQRAQFDRETKQLYKSQAYVKFWETIYMDRFLETADPQKRSQSDAIQAELDACRDEIMIRTQNGEQGSMEAEELWVRTINLKKELESIWRDETEAPYELASVFIHDGPSPSWGHYFLYSRHLPECPDSWFKYNDSEVTKVSKNEVMADTMGSTANPYLLVFVRKGEEVIDTVKRVNIMMCHEKMREIK